MIERKIKVIIDYFKTLRSSKFFKVFAWDVLSKGTDFALLPIYLKVLSQEEYGFYTYTLYIITTISGIVKLGVDTSVSKMYYEQDKYERGKMLFSANIIWIIFFCLLFLFAITTGSDTRLFTELMNISISDYNQIKIFIFAFILFNLVQTTLNVFFVIDDNAIIYQKYNLIRTLGGNLVVIVLLLFVSKGDKAYFRLYLEPILFLVSFIPLIIIFIKRMTFKIDWKIVKHSLEIGLPMMGTLIVAVVYNLSDKYYLQKSSGFETLAVYNLAIFLTLPVSLIFMSFNTVWLPKFFQEKSSNINLIKSNKYFIRLTIFYLALMIFTQTLLVVGLKTNMLSNSYKNIVYIFPFIFISRVFDVLLQLYNNFIISWGKTVFNLTASLFFGISTLSLNYTIIPIWGLSGAILILLVTSLTRLLIFYFFVKYYLKYEYSSKN